MARRAFLPLVLLALAGPACGPSPAAPSEPGDPLSALGGRAAEWIAAQEAARRAYGAGRWEEAAALYEGKIRLYPGHPPGPLLPASLRSDFYNLACCRALSGRKTAALDALEQAVGEGFEEIGLENIAEDPDFAGLRGEPRWKALLARLSWNDEVRFLAAPEGDSAARVVVEIRGERDLAAGPGAFPSSATVHAIPLPPYREGPGRFSWTTRLDPGERAAEKAAFAVLSAEGSYGGALADRVLLARGARAVRIAWEVLLRRPALFTRAVLEGAAAPAHLLLDRRAERVSTEVVAVGNGSAPDPAVPVRFRVAASVAEALR